MSAQDDGGGPGSGRSARGNEVFGHPLDAAQHFFSQSDPNPASQSNFNSVGNAPSLQTWGNNALNAQQSEVSLMAQGAGRPGQPAGGQRPIFGGGSPVFAQMPTYTPVTRGPELRPQAPSRNPRTRPIIRVQRPPSRASKPASGLSYPSPQAPSPLNYPSSQPAPRRAIRARHPGAAPSYQNAQPQPAPGYQTFQPAAPSQQAGFRHARPITRPISRFVRRASRAPSIPARRPIRHRAITARKAFRASPTAIRTLPMRASRSRRSGGCELPGIELRPELRRSEFRQSEFRQAEFCRCELPGAAGLRRELPRHELSQARMASLSRSRADAATTAMALRPIKASIPSTASPRRITARCRKATRGGSCRPSTPSTISRRRLRSARPSRPAGPRRISTRASGSMPISSMKVRRFPRPAPAPRQA